jgi:hypothetical protein
MNGEVGPKRPAFLFSNRIGDKRMLKQTAGEGIFKPLGSKAESKASATDAASRQIIDAEVAQREAKTAKLREARLAMEARQAAEAQANPAPVKKPARAKVAKR